MEEMLGHRRFSPWQGIVSLMADFTYTSIGMCGRTLGEEYSELIPVSAKTLAEKNVTSRIIAGICSHAPSAFQLAWPRDAARRRGAFSKFMRRFVEHLTTFLRIHMGLFYLWGDYRHLSDRVARIRFLSISGHPYKGPTYSLVGVLVILQLVAQAASAFVSWRRARGAGVGDVAKVAEASRVVSSMYNRSAGESMILSTSGNQPGRKPTCRICMCPTDCTTCAPCGHLFCWECIASWCAVKPSCPLCRSVSPPQQLLPILYYEASPPEKKT